MLAQPLSLFIMYITLKYKHMLAPPPKIYLFEVITLISFISSCTVHSYPVYFQEGGILEPISIILFLSPGRCGALVLK